MHYIAALPSGPLLSDACIPKVQTLIYTHHSNRIKLYNFLSSETTPSSSSAAFFPVGNSHTGPSLFYATCAKSEYR